VKIKKPASKNGVTKFKVRCSRFLYTLKVQDSAKADKIANALPPVLTRKDI
jgi:large subunit ribosomal protein L38e